MKGVGTARVQGLQSIILAKYGIKAQEEQMYEQALVQYKQQMGAQSSSVAPQIKDIAQQFMNLKTDAERKAFLTSLKGKDPEMVKQLVGYLQTIAEQHLDPEETKQEMKDGEPQKVGTSNGAKTKKVERTQDRVKGSKKTAS